jgi:hypothetical protein
MPLMAHQESDLIGRVSEFAVGGDDLPSRTQAFARVQGLVEELGRYQHALGDTYAKADRPSAMRQGQALAAELQQEIQRVSLQIGDALLALSKAGGRLLLGTEDSAHRPTLVTAPRASKQPRPASLSVEQENELITELIQKLGPPRPDLQDAELLAEIAVMDALTEPSALERWGGASPTVQRTFLAMIVARARGRKARTPLPPLAWKQLNEVLSRLPSFSKAHNPGYINGLKLAHQPETSSWLEDATKHFQALERGTEPKRTFETLRAVPSPGPETANVSHETATVEHP